MGFLPDIGRSDPPAVLAALDGVIQSFLTSVVGTPAAHAQTLIASAAMHDARRTFFDQVRAIAAASEVPPELPTLAIGAPQPVEAVPDAVIEAPPIPRQEAKLMARIRLPNATGGKAYHVSLDLAAHDMPDLRIVEIDGLDGTGLAFDAEAQVLSGVAIGGSDTRELTFDARLATHSGIVFEDGARVLLLVNPDPRSLWKDLPTDDAAPFQKPNRAATKLAFGDRTVIAASVRGRSHANIGSFREDDFHIALEDATDPSGWLVIAVSDGAGSAKFSREGSRLATTHAGTTLLSALVGNSELGGALETYTAGAPTDELHDYVLASLGRAAHDACRAITDAAIAQQAEEKDFASTLLLAAVRPCAAGTFVASYWVGDGALALYDGEMIDVLGEGDSGEFSGQTRFLMAAELNKGWPEISRRTRVRVVQRFTALALMTDGVSDPKFATDKKLRDPAAWHTFWRDDLGPALTGDPEALLSWLEFWSPGEHDDRTLVLLY